MTDKTAHEILAALDQWAQEKVKRGEGWAPGQYRHIVAFLNPPAPYQEPEPRAPVPQIVRESTPWTTKKS